MKDVRLPLAFNVRHAQPPSLGLVALVGLMQSVLLPDDTTGDSQQVDWMYVITDDLALPVYLTSRLDNTPSVALCCLDQKNSLPDIASRIAEIMKSQEALPMIQWEAIFSRVEDMLPLFDKSSASPEDDDDYEIVEEKNLKRAKQDIEDSQEGVFNWSDKKPSKKEKEKTPKDKEKDFAKKPKSKDKEKTQKPEASKQAKPEASKKTSSTSSTDLTRRLQTGLRKPNH